MNASHRRRGAWAASVLLALGLTATALVAGTGAAAGTPARTPAGTSRTTLRYAVERPVCAAPKDPDAMRCFAMRRVLVPAGTPGARPFRVPTGAGVGPADGYTPTDLAIAYGLDPTVPRSSQLVAVVNWYRDPNAAADLNTFDSYYHLPKETASSFRVVSQTGGSVAKIKADKGSAGEQSLDIETIRGICHTCRIVLVEANSGTDANLAVAENEAARLHATEISNSFGEREHKVAPSVVKAYDHPGIVITASTGDDGWFSWDRANRNGGSSDGAAAFPSTSPYVVSVGGTSLALNNNGTRQAEFVWNENGQADAAGQSHATDEGAGGSGCSALYAAPAWQAHHAGYAAAGCKGKRLAADVSADADPASGLDVYDSYQSSGWATVGGTSLSAPLTAAMFALAGGSGGAPYPAASLYTQSSAHPTSVFDVVPLTTGPFSGYAQGNGFCGGATTTTCGAAANAYSNGATQNPNGLGSGVLDCSFARNGSNPATPPALDPECNTVAGYDGPTGVGTPRSGRFYTHTNPSLALSGPRSARARTSRTFTVKVTEPVPARVTSYRWSWGDGHTSVTTSARAAHTYTATGRFTVRLTVSDNRYQTSVAAAGITITR